MLPIIPITSEQYVSILEGLDKRAPGRTHVKRGDDGAMIIDDGGT